MISSKKLISVERRKHTLDSDDGSDMDCTVVEYNVSVAVAAAGDSLEAKLVMTPEPRETVSPSPDFDWSLPLERSKVGNPN